MKPKEIAIYGGAFNPPTLWHALVIQQVLESHHVDHIIFSPDGKRADKNYRIDDTHRNRMLEIFFEELQNKHGDRISFSEDFLHQEWVLTTTREVDAHYSETLWVSPWHIFGSDTAKHMKDWSNNPDGYIEQKLKKIFLMRPGYPESFEGFENFIALHLDIPSDISSTLVRESIKNKLAVAQFLTPAVAAYIKKHSISYA